MKHLPAFRALRAFEATVRLGSMTAASHELNVTPGAISRQVSQLEGTIGHPLLERTRQGIAVNPRGRRLQGAVAEAFEALTAALSEAGQSDEQSILTLNLYPTFAIQWLIPRLEALYVSVPHAELRIQTSLKGSDFHFGDVDIGIEVSDGPRPGLHMRRLFGREFSPVCSPALLRQHGSDAATALANANILLSDLHLEKWDTWALMSGVTLAPDRRIRLENSTLAYQAAREGAGFAIGQPVLLERDLSSGRLIEPFSPRLRGQRSYYVACLQERKDLPLIRAVMDWLVEQSSVARCAYDDVAGGPS